MAGRRSPKAFEQQVAKYARVIELIITALGAFRSME